jgi:hypothetical protein
MNDSQPAGITETHKDDYLSNLIAEKEKQILAVKQKEMHLKIELNRLKAQQLTMKGRRSTFREDIRAALRR